MLSSSSSAFISVNCIALLWIESLWVWGQTICNNALEKDYGILDICMCVYVRVPMCITGSPGGPLFSVGPSNPFKSALLIPLSSRSCCGFVQAHDTTPRMGCNFYVLQRSTDIFLSFEKIRKSILLSSLCIHFSEETNRNKWKQLINRDKLMVYNGKKHKYSKYRVVGTERQYINRARLTNRHFPFGLKRNVKLGR